MSTRTEAGRRTRTSAAARDSAYGEQTCALPWPTGPSWPAWTGSLSTWGKVGEVRHDAGSVEAAGVRARWLLAADGLHSPVRHQLGLSRPARSAHRWGLRRHYAVKPWSDLVEVHWAEDAEAYVTPVARD